MRLAELLTEGAPQALTFAVANTIKKLRAEKAETEMPAAQLSLQVEIDQFKKLQDVLDDQMDAREQWKGMSRQSKAKLPMTLHIKDYLS